MRGLNAFISDIRNCPTKEREVQRVEKELANIRQQYPFKLDSRPKKAYPVTTEKNTPGNCSTSTSWVTKWILVNKRLFS
jgi:hypothetical protein